MSKRYLILNKRFLIWPLAFTVPAVAVLLAMGFWQLERLAWKEGLIEKRATALARSEGQDFEVVVADNSDDPAPLADYLTNQLADPRFRLLPPEASVLPMVSNWERALEHARGRWISVIGDDDYIDPRLVAIIRVVGGIIHGRLHGGWAAALPKPAPGADWARAAQRPAALPRRRRSAFSRMNPAASR